VGVFLALEAGDDVTAGAELLEGEDADGLLPEGAGVSGFGGLEEVTGDLAEALDVHAPAVVVDRDQGVLPPPPQDDANAAAGPPHLDVLIGGVGDELVQRVLGVLVGLTGDQDRLGEVADAETHLLSGHRTARVLRDHRVARRSRRRRDAQSPPAGSLRCPSSPAGRPALHGPAGVPTETPRAVPEAQLERSSPLDQADGWSQGWPACNAGSTNGPWTADFGPNRPPVSVESDPLFRMKATPRFG
jgi:hypothetical protein